MNIVETSRKAQVYRVSLETTWHVSFEAFVRYLNYRAVERAGVVWF